MGSAQVSIWPHLSGQKGTSVTAVLLMPWLTQIQLSRLSTSICICNRKESTGSEQTTNRSNHPEAGQHAARR
jgi:hypothetical protein